MLFLVLAIIYFVMFVSLAQTSDQDCCGMVNL